MPLLASTFRPSAFLHSAHLQTILPTLTRRVEVEYERQSIATPDEDVLELDWARTPGGNRTLAVICHGLEGSSRSVYAVGMARAMNRIGIDALAWNHRGCGGLPNRQLRSYHSGATDDLMTVLASVPREYSEIVLIGFSLGGNIVLKYLGDAGANVDPRITTALAFSVPCDLASSAHKLSTRANAVYMRRFMSTLRAKAIEKVQRFTYPLDVGEISRMRTFLQFDDRFTAPVHGFRDAADYWARASSLPVIPNIRVRTLLVNALDDPFLTPLCFPTDAARSNPQFFLETPAHGGHVGFIDSLARQPWSERRAVEWINDEAGASRKEHDE